MRPPLIGRGALAIGVKELYPFKEPYHINNTKNIHAKNIQ